MICVLLENWVYSLKSLNSNKNIEKNQSLHISSLNFIFYHKNIIHKAGLNKTKSVPAKKK